jgi:engulfment/cell motility protein 1
MHYVDSQSKFPVRGGLEDLPDRLDITTVTEIATVNCAPPPSSSDTSAGVAGSERQPASSLSFSLITPEGSLADVIAPDVSRWADWTDGLNMLRRDGGHVSSEETLGFINALTEIGLKIKLLGACDFPCFPSLPPSLLACPPTGLLTSFFLLVDLSGDKVEIPSGLIAGPPPTNNDFFFSDLYEPQ